MHLMLKKAIENEIPRSRAVFQAYGAKVPLFDGLDTWFDRTNEAGRQRGLHVRHFLISSGLREMIEGTPVAKYFERIYASSYLYDENHVAVAPALALNYTTKTQFLFRINKGALDLADDSLINAFVPKPDRPVPFENMVYIGDGSTDIPCFRLVREQGGHSIAVYAPKKKGAKAKAEALIREERVDFAVPADYREGSLLEGRVLAVMDHVAALSTLRRLERAAQHKVELPRGDDSGNEEAEEETASPCHSDG